MTASKASRGQGLFLLTHTMSAASTACLWGYPNDNDRLIRISYVNSRSTDFDTGISRGIRLGGSNHCISTIL